VNCIQGFDRKLWETDSVDLDTDRIIKEVGFEAMDWINLAQERDTWWALVKIVMHPLVPWKCREFDAEDQLTPQESSSMELVVQ
jgi:hypothetical protein